MVVLPNRTNLKKRGCPEGWYGRAYPCKGYARPTQPDPRHALKGGLPPADPSGTRDPGSMISFLTMWFSKTVFSLDRMQ